jgi:hypothetical protein
MREELRKVIEKEIINGKELAHILGVDESWVRYLRKRGKIDSAYIGHIPVYDIKDFGNNSPLKKKGKKV